MFITGLRLLRNKRRPRELRHRSQQKNGRFNNGGTEKYDKEYIAYINTGSIVSDMLVLDGLRHNLDSVPDCARSSKLRAAHISAAVLRPCHNTASNRLLTHRRC